MERKSFPIKQASTRNWEEVFKKPCPIAHESFVTAEATLKKKGALNLNHPKAAGIKDESFKAPVLAHWIRHREFGDYFIDTGMDSSYQKRPYGLYRGLLKRVFMGKCVQEVGQDIRARIQQDQIDLKGVFFTHLHFDHISGAVDLPKDASLRYVTGKEETYFVIDKKFLFRSPDFLEGVETLYGIDFADANAVDMPVVGKCADVFADGSLWAISTPGHTQGHVSFLVNSEPGPVLITGDACLVKTGFDMGIGPGTYSNNLEESQRSLEKMIELVQKYPNIKVVFGHELP
ncbi:MAG: MBL fold metallo-hydrolase [Candidatus Aminicenantes bacterium]|nr:MAG: MBL fold metallo-hydrolase [Candidatus Aminicenantes bacterium]